MSVIIKNESLNFRMIWLEESYANEVVISVFFEVDSFFSCVINLLRRAMTHASFSQEHNKALTIFGTHLIETSVSLKSLAKDIDISSKVLTRLIAEVSNVNSSCALDGHRLGLERVIRVSSKTDASNSAILCAAFRAFFGAVATDSGMVDERRTRFS